MYPISTMHASPAITGCANQQAPKAQNEQHSHDKSGCFTGNSINRRISARTDKVPASHEKRMPHVLTLADPDSQFWLRHLITKKISLSESMGNWLQAIPTAGFAQTVAPKHIRQETIRTTEEWIQIAGKAHASKYIRQEAIRTTEGWAQIVDKAPAPIGVWI